MSGALWRAENTAEGWATGLRAWVRGDDTIEAEAAEHVIGEMGVRLLRYLRSKFEKE